MSTQSNITVEDRLRNYLDNESKLFADDQVLSRFYSWQKQVLKSVMVEPISGIAGIQQAINAAGKFHDFEPKRCYDNALQLTIASLDGHETNYVEGFVVVNERMLFGHAWNSTASRYFDHTAELMNSLLIDRGLPLPTQQYFKVAELPLPEVFPHTLSGDETAIQVLHFLKLSGLHSSDLKTKWNVIPNAEYLP